MNSQITVTTNEVFVDSNQVVVNTCINTENTNVNTQPPPANVQITMSSDGTSFQQHNGRGATQVSNYVRINVARQESQNTLTFLQAVFVIILSSVCCSIFIGLYLSVPISMLVIGALYKDDCPIEPMIPTYLLLAGSIGFVTSLISLVQGEGKRMSTVEVLLHLIQFFWFITGSIFVYRVYDDVTYDSANSKEYCHKVLYLFAFWHTTCSYMVLGLCCLCGCAACLSEL
ncbi:transmembrane protein 272-like [Physella acuta]|uniref:transmembrane protein 272-like n=1 Tax=Physella acuta TaxID=109671 RepID=UPI0027DB0307|nr:transmembrane protein 272-like [Physella acuta]XP_059153136.1 transmembrane protein 272-like [Physella acuta]